LYRSCRLRLHRSVCVGYGSNLGLRKKARKSLFSFCARAVDAVRNTPNKCSLQRLRRIKKLKKFSKNY
jgi:hypothetical protein